MFAAAMLVLLVVAGPVVARYVYSFAGPVVLAFVLVSGFALFVSVAWWEWGGVPLLGLSPVSTR